MMAGASSSMSIAQQGEKRLRFVLRLGEKQLLPLVDREDQRRRLGLAPPSAAIGVALSASACRSGLSFAAPAWIDRAQVGARDRYFGRRKRGFERREQARSRR